MTEKPNLIILTTTFPGVPSKQEMWLLEELIQTHQNYNSIRVVPSSEANEYATIPGQNSAHINLKNKSQEQIGFRDLLSIISIVLSDFWIMLAKGALLKEFRYNLSLIKQMVQTSKYVLKHCDDLTAKKTIVYSYWADNLATCGAIMKKMRPDLIHVTRAHSYEIYEEQTKYGYIPFRKFQLRYLNKIYTDSFKGYLYLKEKHPSYANSLQCSYVGVDDCGLNPLPNVSESLQIVSCSYVRGQKRLHLFPPVLMNVKTPVLWHLIGEGPDLPEVKALCAKLPPHIQVKYVGYLSAEEVTAYYKNTPLNLFISVSSIEGLPVSLIEAVSFGIPILSTDVGGCNEICKEETGILIPKEFDAVKVAAQIDEFARSQKNTMAFRNGVRKFWSENFNSRTNYTKFSETICSLNN